MEELLPQAQVDFPGVWRDQATWKAIAAYAYILICLFDFIVIPVISDIRHPSQQERIKMVQAIPIEERGLTPNFM